MKRYKSIFKESGIISYDELKGAIEFSPKFMALSFFIKERDHKIYRNNPNGEGYLEVRPRDAVRELRLTHEESIAEIIENYAFGNLSLNDLLSDLRRSNKFFIKEMK